MERERFGGGDLCDALQMGVRKDRRPQQVVSCRPGYETGALVSKELRMRCEDL